MELNELLKKAKEIKEKYREVNPKLWGATEYAQGFVGDVGDLLKLVMAKNEFRKVEQVDAKLAHELSDCLWSILIIADELGIDEEDFFTHHYTGKHFQSILLYYLCKNPKGKISTDHFDEHERQYADKAEWVDAKRVHGLKFYNPVDSVGIIKKALQSKN